MRKTKLTDRALCDAVSEMARGLIDADLGGGVVKLDAHVESEALQDICHDCQE